MGVKNKHILTRDESNRGMISYARKRNSLLLYGTDALCLFSHHGPSYVTGGTIVIIGPMVHKKNCIFTYFYSQYVVLFTMVPR